MKTTKLSTLIAAFAVAASLPAPAAAEPCNGGNAITILRASRSGEPHGPAIDVSAQGVLNLRLAARGGAEVDLDSLRIRYGFFDITDRITRHVGALSNVMHIDGDLLPVGKYTVGIRVRDTAGRATRLKLTFAVAKPATTCNESLTVELPSARGQQFDS